MPQKKIIIIGTNETARVTALQSDVILAALNLTNRAAVLVADKEGNASLTLIDAKTDLDFLQGETGFMEGEYTIDAIFPQDADQLLKSSLMTKLGSLGLGNVPSLKGLHQTLRTSREGTVMFEDGLLKQPKPYLLLGLLHPNRVYTYYNGQSPMPASQYSARTSCPSLKVFSLMELEHRLNQLLADEAAAMPRVVHAGSGWMRSSGAPRLTPAVSDFVNGLDRTNLVASFNNHPFIRDRMPHQGGEQGFFMVKQDSSKEMALATLQQYFGVLTSLEQTPATRPQQQGLEVIFEALNRARAESQRNSSAQNADSHSNGASDAPMANDNAGDDDLDQEPGVSCLMS